MSQDQSQMKDFCLNDIIVSVCCKNELISKVINLS